MNVRAHLLLSANLFLSVSLAALAFASASAHAADESNDGTLHVLRPTIHAEQEKAELCLEFDHALDVGDKGNLASGIKLESGSKTLSIAPANISVTNTLLCLPSLDHRKEYRITVSNLRGAEGEKLSNPYSLTFSIPDRQPSLAFSGSNDGIMAWQDSDPSLRAMNVGRVHMELFRVSDMNAMIDAWRQRMQTTLAPSESATYARDHGQSVWKDDVALDSTPNKPQTPRIAVQGHVDNLTPGLYLIVATAEKTISKDDEPEFTPVAAQWLLRSDLKIRAVRSADGYYALAENADGTAAAANTHVSILDRDQKTLTDSRSETDGIAKLVLSDDKRGNAALMIGQSDKGDIAFADLSTQDQSFILSDADMTLTPDKTFYMPGSNALIALAAHDTHGRTLPVKGSNLQILRPDADRSFYASIPVPDLRDGLANVAVPVPALNGAWVLVWLQNDGRVLSETKLHVTSNAAAPHLELSADRALLPDDGEVNLSIRTFDQDKTAIPYIAGRASVAWSIPDHLFPGWDDYHFGNSENNVTAPSNIASFMTDEKGEAQLHVNLTPPSDGAPLHAAIIHIESDPVAGAADPAPLTLPVRPRDFIIGIKPMSSNGRFAENSQARFEVIALDGDGKRRDANDLTYQIYEEGRSFAWFQDEGRWNYKPQQQQRRVSGGALTVKADGVNHIDWPVTAGNYRLDVTNADGKIVARLHFSAGWGLSKADNASAKINLTAPDAVHVGQETKIRFTLDQPAMVNVFIADNHIRKIIHQFKPAGDNQISFTPDNDWGQQVSLWIDTGAYGASGQMTLHVTHDGAAKEIAATPVIPPTSPDAAFAISMTPPPLLKTGDSLTLSLTLKNNQAADGAYRYALTASGGLKLSGAASGTITLNAGQSRNFALPLSALQSGMHELKLDITGPHNFHLGQNWPIMVLAGDKQLEIIAAQGIDARQAWTPPHDKLHMKAEPSVLFVSPEPMYDLPTVLQTVLDAHPFTTIEIAGQLETMRLWRDVILASGMMPEALFEAQRRDLLLRLLVRQKADGSFPSLSSQDSDIINTSAALIAMAPLSQTSSAFPLPATKPAVDQAVNWLHNRLSNTWFDEKERAERAKAYAALATADRLDMANLHYFSDTSAEKDLPALAWVQMATAFAHNHDRDASLFWLNKAKIEKASPDIAPSLMTLLAENPYFEPHDLLPALEKLSHDNAQQPVSDFAHRIAFLRALWNVTDRAGAWRVNLTGAEKTVHNILVAGIPEKSAGFAVRNPMDKPLFMSELRATQKPNPARSAISRHIYRMNGSEIGDNDNLERDQIYMITLEGPWIGDDNAFIAIRDDLTPAMHPISCALDATLSTGDSLSWLKGLLLTPPAACEKSAQAIDALLTRNSKSRNTWRIAYLAKADNGGSFNLTPAVARDIYGHQESLMGRADTVRIR